MKMSKEADFFIYLLERYAEYKQKSVKSVLKEWDALKLTDFIYDMYEIYHIVRRENAFLDIDSLMETGKAAW